MVKKASLLSHLESILGPDGVGPGEELRAFAVDGLTPRAVASPSTYEQVAAVMRYADAEGLAVIPRGGGAHMHIGNVPSRYDLALSLSRLDQVVEHEPADLTVTCQAGITLPALQSRLGRHGQLAPLGPPSGEGATIGGILAANVSGPARHAYGAPRDFTIGLRVVTADGRVTRAGGRVVKNVAGYDLCKLYVGSLGTLGIIVEATLKLAPQPAAERTVIAAFDTPARACAFAAELQRRGLALRSVQLLNPPAAATARIPADKRSTLVLDLAGAPQAVERSHRDIADLAKAGNASLTDAAEAAVAIGDGSWLDPPTDATVLCKGSALPTRIPALIDALEDGDGPPPIVALPTIGVLYAAWSHPDAPERTVSRLRAAAAAEGGSLVLERCPPDLKRRLDVFGDAPGPSFALMRRVKQRFDPNGVLCPGRYVGRL